MCAGLILHNSRDGDAPFERRAAPTGLLFIAIWLMMNLVFGLLGPYGMADPGGGGQYWVAHLGGFVRLLIGLLEKPPLSASGGPAMSIMVNGKTANNSHFYRVTCKLRHLPQAKGGRTGQ